MSWLDSGEECTHAHAEWQRDFNDPEGVCDLLACANCDSILDSEPAAEGSATALGEGWPADYAERGLPA